MVILVNPVHPGEVLKTEFLDEMGLTAGKVTKANFVPRSRIERIIRRELGVTADTASRLARLFGTMPEFWMNLQRGYDLAVVAQDNKLRDDLEQIERRAG
ncbi:HigA family addiction module antitoxin [Roseobacter litoralis]|uniref:HigA family addiction module antitoxin n=1 Tax=Roseobacter litoralis TaxID=42443 RepID=UPI00248FF54C|nr:HigA family addiction module antitoxin [Roseobacter litoralis]